MHKPLQCLVCLVHCLHVFRAVMRSTDNMGKTCKGVGHAVWCIMGDDWRVMWVVVDVVQQTQKRVRSWHVEAIARYVLSVRVRTPDVHNIV